MVGGTVLIDKLRNLQVGDRIKYAHLPNYTYTLVRNDGEPQIDKTQIKFDSTTMGTSIQVDWVDWEGDVGTRKIKRFKGEDFKVPSEILKDWWEVVEVTKEHKKSWDSDKDPDDPTAIFTDVEYDQYDVHARHASGLNWHFRYTDVDRFSNHVRLQEITIQVGGG